MTDDEQAEMTLGFARVLTGDQVGTICPTTLGQLIAMLPPEQQDEERRRCYAYMRRHGITFAGGVQPPAS